MTTTELPTWTKPLFEPHRYKIAYGGRGSAKSWSVARALVIMAAQRKMRVLCTREFQSSISESVHELLRSQIDALGLSALYSITDNEITNSVGSQFLFKGLRHNISSIKSMEGFDVVWCEEAEAISYASWETLIPTMRKAGSEIWITFNPRKKSDPTWQRFIVNPPPDSFIVKVSYRDNPWFPEELEKERYYLQNTNPVRYQHVWEGEFDFAPEGSIYGAELSKAKTNGQIRNVPVDRAVEVHTAWDLGINDPTAIWFFQSCAGNLHLIDHYETSGKSLDEISRDVKARGYNLGTCLLPHDSAAKDLTSGRSPSQILATLGVGRVKVLERQDVDHGIANVRLLFNRLYIDEAKCDKGLEAIQAYSRRFNKTMQEYSNEPLHDWASHSADALRYLVQGQNATGTNDFFTRKLDFRARNKARV